MFEMLREGSSIPFLTKSMRIIESQDEYVPLVELLSQKLAMND